ncbi:NTP transferase domain-containing protein [Candidatus Woesearchaeota archaeon]|nr:NTP transferase domain-containing protein [Candidatus Woesearchaeota archaeon]
MRGVILAGGFGSRLGLLTRITNKHLLPVYDKPMIFYPLQKLLDAGIKDILIVSGPEYSGHFLRLLGSGREFGVRFTYEIQDEAGGIAQALGLAEGFADGNNVAVILGDNIFEDNLSNEINSFTAGAKLFLKEVADANRFGVAQISGNKIIGIEEKPKKPKSSYAVTGLYLYDFRVFDIIKSLKPSSRGELEITDVNNHYIKDGKMSYSIVKGFWSDAGTYDSLLRASTLVKSSRDKKKE